MSNMSVLGICGGLPGSRRGAPRRAGQAHPPIDSYIASSLYATSFIGTSHPWRGGEEDVQGVVTASMTRAPAELGLVQPVVRSPDGRRVEVVRLTPATGAGPDLLPRLLEVCDFPL